MWYLNTETTALINLNELESIETFPLCSKGGGAEIVGCSKNGERYVLYCIIPQNDDKWDEIEKGLSYKDKAIIFLDALQYLLVTGKVFSNNVSSLNELTMLEFIKRFIKGSINSR